MPVAYQKFESRDAVAGLVEQKRKRRKDWCRRDYVSKNEGTRWFAGVVAVETLAAVLAHQSGRTLSRNPKRGRASKSHILRACVLARGGAPPLFDANALVSFLTY